MKITLTPNGNFSPVYDDLKLFKTIKEIQKKRRVKITDLGIFESELDLKLDNLSLDTVDLIRKYE